MSQSSLQRPNHLLYLDKVLLWGERMRMRRVEAEEKEEAKAEGWREEKGNERMEECRANIEGF